MRGGDHSAAGRRARARSAAADPRLLSRSSRSVVALAGALALSLAACDGGSHVDNGASDSGTAVEAGTGTAMTTAAPSSALPTIALVSPLPDNTALDASGSTVTQAGLVTLLSEQLTDAGSGTVQTVVCSGGLSLSTGKGATCTATLEGSSSGDQTWQAYPAHGPDASPAILLLQGQPLSEEFSSVLTATGTAIVAHAIDPTYGSAGGVGAEQLRQDAQGVLHDEHSPVELSGCEGTLAFTALEPVECHGSSNGSPVQAIVLPGSFLSEDQGLIVVTRPSS